MINGRLTYVANATVVVPSERANLDSIINQRFDDVFGRFTVTVGRVSTARLLGMCGNHG
jgi:hypothetical protein